MNLKWPNMHTASWALETRVYALDVSDVPSVPVIHLLDVLTSFLPSLQLGIDDPRTSILIWNM